MKTSLSLQARAQQHPLFTALLLVLPIIIGTVYLVPSYFETNDDVAFLLMVSGRVLSPEPTGWIFFMHIVLGQALAWLYRLNPDIPWYGLMHLGSLTVAYWMILYAVLLKEFSWRRVSLVLLCLVSLGLPFALGLQFTKTAFLVGLSGALLLATTLHQHATRSATRGQLLRRLVAATLLLMLALTIRRESLHLVGVLSLPLFTWLAWTAWQSQRLPVFLGVCASVSLVLVLLDATHFHRYAQDPAWHRFSVLNPLKSEFIDYKHIPYTAATRPYFQEVGWSENDYHCLMNWWYVDPQVYAPEKMHAIAAHFPLTTRFTADSLNAVASLATCLDGGAIWIVVPLCAALALFGLRNFAAWLILLATLGATGLTLVLFSVFLKLPLYVCQPILTAPCWIALWLSEDIPESRPASPWHFVRQVTGGLLVGVVFGVLLFRSDTPLAKGITGSQVTVKRNHQFREALARLSPTPTQTFVAWGEGFPYEAILPLERHGYLDNFRVVAVAAGNQSPIQRRMLEIQGIADLHRALFEREDVFLSFRSKDVQGMLLTRYLAEHYAVSITLTPIFDRPPLRFWKVTRVSAPASASKDPPKSGVENDLATGARPTHHAPSSTASPMPVLP
jgi:hypothetical protein